VCRQEENRKLLHAFETGGGNEHEGSLVWDVGDDQEDIEHKAVAGSRLRSMGCRERLAWSCGVQHDNRVVQHYLCGRD